MGVIERSLQKQPEFAALCGDVQHGQLPVCMTGLGHIHKVLTIHALCAVTGHPAVVVVPDESEATRLCEDLTALGRSPLFLPARDLSLQRVESASREYEQLRLGTTIAWLPVSTRRCSLRCRPRCCAPVR